ncbi:MAG TPA: septum formation initiator family protein [Bacteroidetes bacterium]|nr:septum formation initiator family protein [Bacteroidota bacterium]
MKWSDLIEKIPPVFKNKYVITIILFLLWIIFFDANNLISRVRERMELNKLKAEKEYYLEKIESDSSRLMELRTDNENLEKFAREQYRMKNPDEDIYIIISPEEEKKNIKDTR